MLRLYDLDRSPYCWKVRMVLAEKGIPCERVPPPPDKGNDPAFARLNPFRLTPTLVLEDGRSLWESTVINEYLEDAYPSPPLLPAEPGERARVRMLEDSTDQYWTQASRPFVLAQFDYAPPHLVRKPPHRVDWSALEEGRARIHQHLRWLEEELRGRAWFGGSQFTLADVALVPPLTASMRLVGVLPNPRYPNIAAWSERVMARPSYAASKPAAPLTIREA